MHIRSFRGWLRQQLLQQLAPGPALAHRRCCSSPLARLLPLLLHCSSPSALRARRRARRPCPRHDKATSYEMRVSVSLAQLLPGVCADFVRQAMLWPRVVNWGSWQRQHKALRPTITSHCLFAHSIALLCDGRSGSACAQMLAASAAASCVNQAGGESRRGAGVQCTPSSQHPPLHSRQPVAPPPPALLQQPRTMRLAADLDGSAVQGSCCLGCSCLAASHRH